MVGGLVRPLRVRFVEGHRELTVAGSSSTTNDFGECRLFGLPPGNYYLSAQVRPSSVEVENAEVGYVTTYFPNASSPSGAQRLTLGLGQTLTNIVTTVVPARTAPIAGSAVHSTGEPFSGGSINILQSGGGSVLGLPGGLIHANGTFSLPALPAGEYILQAQSTESGPEGVSESASARITLGGEDVTDVRLVAKARATVKGRVVFDALSTSTPSHSSLRIALEYGSVNGMIIHGNDQRINDDFTFGFKTLSEKARVRLAAAPPGWHLRAVRLHGLDVTDAGIDLSPEPSSDEIEIELTNRWPEISGHVLKGKGEPVGDYTVIVFPLDRQRLD